MCHNRSFLLVALLASLGFVPGAFAVPAVKMLGQKNTAAAPVSTQKVGSNQLSRTGSVRSIGKTAKPVSVSKTGKNNTTVLKAPSEPQRLSIGKYIHGTGVSSGIVKPANTGSNSAPAASSNDLIILNDRIKKLEDDIETKQDELTAGDGIEIKNNTISVAEGLQNQINKLATDKVDVASLAENYYDRGQTQELIEEQVQQIAGQDNKTIYDFTSEQRKKVYVVDTFDEGFLEEGN